MSISIVLVDDHVVLRNGLAAIISNLGHTVLFECSNGKDLEQKWRSEQLPDVVLMDINMPQMDGFEATTWLRQNYPLVRVLALSMYDDESAIIRMIRYGAKGYVLKEAEPQELNQAIRSVYEHGFYYSDLVTGKLVRAIQDSGEGSLHDFNDRELTFLKLACTEMTYKEIAWHMHLSPRTIDGYRDALFNKLELKSRVGLVLYAIKNHIVQVD